jgi:hypothetical protein
MMSRMVRTTFLAVAVLAALSCSKTQDTAPERRVFGDPPTIVSVEQSFDPQAHAECDFSNIVRAGFCADGVTDLQLQTGRGWTVAFDGPDRTNRHIVFSDVETTEPGVFIEGHHAEAIFRVKVTDPNSVPGGKSDILLVSSSYRQPDSTSETTLVLFDDGSSNKFALAQIQQPPAEACTVDIDSGVCECHRADYQNTSGDQTSNDGTFTRKFALTQGETSGFLKDCIMQSKKELPVTAPVGSTFTFKIEVVDREGNLVTWPTNLTGKTVVDQFVCNGDSCGCCYLHTVSQLANLPECKGLDGMISPSFFPNGFCKDGI